MVAAREVEEETGWRPRWHRLRLRRASRSSVMPTIRRTGT